MPIISKFYGIIVRLMKYPQRGVVMYANYDDYEVIVDPATLRILSGVAPSRVVDLITEWSRAHQDELKAALESVKYSRTPAPIAPLQ